MASDKTIEVGPDGPTNDNVGIGKASRKIIWSCEGGGKVNNVTFTDSSAPFSNGGKNGNNYQFDYDGSTGNQTWDYQVTSNCSAADDSDVFGGPFDAKLNNGGG